MLDVDADCAVHVPANATEIIRFNFTSTEPIAKVFEDIILVEGLYSGTNSFAILPLREVSILHMWFFSARCPAQQLIKTPQLQLSHSEGESTLSKTSEREKAAPASV
ncbi:hypothetical protein Q8A73_002762 [Channa argus]|nr:hypothetical protein Q8A73_002762 [Channa argus]